MPGRRDGAVTSIDLSEEQLEQLHAVHLELYGQLRRVCAKHSIRYFAMYGTLLGAIRHQGFIPWDDDLDLGMLRQDYDRFCAVVQDEIGEEYTFQTCDTDPHYASPLGKLRKHGTVFGEEAVGSAGQHEGIFIDVFPLDVRPAREPQRMAQHVGVYVLVRLLMIKGGYVIGRGRPGRRPIRFLAGLVSRCIPRSVLVRMLDREMRRYDDRPTPQVISAAGPYGAERETVEASWVDDLVAVPFEDSTIPVFRAADAYLRRVYGDYLTPPPPGQRSGHHRLVALSFGPDRAEGVPRSTPTRLLVVWSSLARTSGGGWTFARGLAPALAAADDLDVTMVLPRGTELTSLVGDGPCHVIWVRPLVGPLKILRDLWCVHRWASWTSADLVLVPHEWGAWTRGVPVVNVIQNVLFLHPVGRREHPVKSRVMTGLARATSPFLSGTIAVSESSRALWRDLTGLDAMVLPEGVLVDPLEAVSQDRDDLVLVMTGRDPYKNPDLAHRVAARLAGSASSPAVVVIGAHGDDGRRVRHIDVVSPDDLRSLYQRAAVVVMTSGVESFGLPAFEARAAGCSVVVLDGTPMAEWLGGDPLVHIVPADPGALVEAAEEALAETDVDRSAPSRFAWTAVGPRWATALSELVSPGGARSAVE